MAAAAYIQFRWIGLDSLPSPSLLSSTYHMVRYLTGSDQYLGGEKKCIENLRIGNMEFRDHHLDFAISGLIAQSSHKPNSSDC